jgi:bifunctional non-homologous end joining protein LigD
MALAAYKQKRDLKSTPEPGGGKSAKNELIFVVQRHKASHLHYDFRLECNGVLKSWAVPKGPSMNPEDKRLAMMVEDHPYDYKDFSGVIPEGNYGAGLVEIWDSGTYSDLEKNNKKTAEKKISEGIEKGNLKFRLNGKKLKGEFALVKVKDSKNGENAWLLLKHKDEFAVDKAYDSEQLTAKNSPINKWLNQNQDKAPAKKKSRRLTHSKFFMMRMAS